MKRKYIIGSSISILLLLLSTQTALGNVEYNSIIEQKNKILDNLNKVTDGPPVICALLKFVEILLGIWVIIALNLGWIPIASLIIMTIIYTIAHELNCDWANLIPSTCTV